MFCCVAASMLWFWQQWGLVGVPRTPPPSVIAGRRGCIVGKELRRAVGACLSRKNVCVEPLLEWRNSLFFISASLVTKHTWGVRGILWMECRVYRGKAWTSRGEGPQHFRNPALLMMCKIGLVYLGACFTVSILLLFSCFGNFSGLVLISLWTH